MQKKGDQRIKMIVPTIFGLTVRSLHESDKAFKKHKLYKQDTEPELRPDDSKFGGRESDRDSVAKLKERIAVNKL